MSETNSDSWLKWSKYVLKELERLDRGQRNLGENIRVSAVDIVNLRLEVAKIAVGVSLVTSAVTGIATSLIVWLLTK